MPKKARSDSAHIQTKILTDSLRDIKPPKHLRVRDQDEPFFRAILEARVEWTMVDLAHAVNLARAQSDLERLQLEVEIEGDVIENRRGTLIPNPKHQILETLSKRSIALSRMVQVHAQATMGESKLQRGKNSEKRKAMEVMEELDDDDNLIGKPSFN